METQAIVQLIIQHGLKSVNLSMFSDSEKKAIMKNVGEIYLRQGQKKEFLSILEYLDGQQFKEEIEKMARQCFDVGEYEPAVLLYEKIGNSTLAAFIRENFLT